MSIAQSETEEELSTIAVTASEDGFKFRTVRFVDVILVVAHFSSEAKGEDGIPECDCQGFLVPWSPPCYVIQRITKVWSLSQRLEKYSVGTAEKDHHSIGRVGVPTNRATVLSV